LFLIHLFCRSSGRSADGVVLNTLADHLEHLRGKETVIAPRTVTLSPPAPSQRPHQGPLLDDQQGRRPRSSGCGKRLVAFFAEVPNCRRRGRRRRGREKKDFSDGVGEWCNFLLRAFLLRESFLCGWEATERRVVLLKTGPHGREKMNRKLRQGFLKAASMACGSH
jgi:hypothetical protein